MISWPTRTLAVRQQPPALGLVYGFVANLDSCRYRFVCSYLFERYGTVDRVNLVTDRDTGRSRGFAFVEMSNTEEAYRAIAGLNGHGFLKAAH